MSKSLQDLAQKISQLLAGYNRDLAFDEDDRIATIQLMMVRSEERATEDKPASVFITPTEFVRAPAGKETVKAPTFEYGKVTVSYSMSNTGNMACCAPGWVGVFDSQGVPHGCYPTSQCNNYVGPLRCAV